VFAHFGTNKSQYTGIDWPRKALGKAFGTDVRRLPESIPNIVHLEHGPNAADRAAAAHRGTEVEVETTKDFGAHVGDSVHEDWEEKVLGTMSASCGAVASERSPGWDGQETASAPTYSDRQGGNCL
jgi:hypothetical protein